MSIHHTTFSLELLSESSYELTIQFLGDQEELISEKQFQFANSAQSNQGEILDLYSQNGVCQDDLLNHLFEKGDTSGIQKVLKKPLPKGSTLFTLDLQDSLSKYEAAGSVRQFDR